MLNAYQAFGSRLLDSHRRFFPLDLNPPHLNQVPQPSLIQLIMAFPLTFCDDVSAKLKLFAFVFFIIIQNMIRNSAI